MRNLSRVWVLVGSWAVVCGAAKAAGEVVRPDAAAAPGVATAAGSSGISPGSVDGFVPAAGPCPTFSWTGPGASRGVELQVLRVADLGGPVEEPALLVELPAGATSWTPPGDRCLAAGERYAWSVRPIGAAEAPAGGWSEPLLFEVAALPSAAEVERALRILRDYAAAAGAGDLAAPGGGGRPGPAPTPTGDALPVASAAETPFGGGPMVAVRGEVVDPGGETYGVRGLSRSPDGAGVRADNLDAAGADLVLGGTPEARLTEEGLARDSAADLTFDFANPGAGRMSLAIDGAEVATTASILPTVLAGDGSGSGLDADLLDGQDSAAFAAAAHAHDGADITSGAVAEPRIDALLARDAEVLPTVLAGDGSGSGLDADLLDGLDSTAFVVAGSDDWVNETGDAMSGTLTIDVAAGFALQTAAGDSIDVGGDLYKAGERILTSTALSSLALGQDALAGPSPAGFNTALGAGALQNIAGGGWNTAVGSQALNFNQGGAENTAVGYSALDANSSGLRNVAVGVSALGANAVGSNNTAVGFSALLSNTASGNTAVGWNALDSNTSGAGNVAVGAAALNGNETGASNTALGASALAANVTGANNTAVGHQALLNATTGNNTALGSTALFANATGSGNTALGRDALGDNAAGSDNVAVGSFALFHATGSGNVGVGALAGNALVAGNDNVFIASPGVAADSGTIRIGTGGTHTRAFVAGIDGVTVAGGTAVFIKPDGQLGTVTSSRRFKEEVAELDGIEERLLALHPVAFRYTEEAAGAGERPIEYGLIAEEVAEVFPELVVRDAEGRPLTVRYHLLAPLLLHELQAERERLGRELEVLRAELAAVRGESGDGAGSPTDAAGDRR